MRNISITILIVAICVSSVYGVILQKKTLPGYYTKYNLNTFGQLSSYSYIYTGEKTIPEQPFHSGAIAIPLYSDTAVLWVDRNHLNAVAENITISGDGMSILAGWWLNNERTSLYRTLGSGIPLWTHSIPLADWQIDVSSSEDGHLLSGVSVGSPFILWDKACSIPIKEFRHPAGFSGRQCAISKDGSIATVAADNGSTGRLFVFSSNGDSLYSANFDRGNGVYGVELSQDGTIALVSTYYVLSVFENGSLRDTISNYGQTAAKISGSGDRIVKGDFSGKVTLYEWNGTSYAQQWVSTIGGPWVAAVDISNDGSTIMAGTGYNNGKSVMFDASSPTPIWTYQNYGSYGAYVKAVSLCDDGSIGVASSWGDTAQTGTFYVLTVHSKTTSAPIIGVTRNDEPGSLFDCDVSSDGQYITAGGKAVHAYQMGNGGEVYSILVGSTPSVNAATESIDAPAHLIQTGNVITPEATFKNYGDNTVSFDVYFSIEDSLGMVIYSSSTTVSNLSPGTSTQKTFSPTWSPPGYNYYQATVWCELTGDQYPGDDTLSLAIKCFHDAEARKILVPFDETTINMQITPQALVCNNGSYTEPIEAILTVKDTLENPVYLDTTNSSPILPETEATVTFSQLTPAEIGNHTCELKVNVTDDIKPGNDTKSKIAYVSYEIIYDDGTPETYYIVSSTYDNNKFAVKFTPTLLVPFYFTGGRIYVNATGAFDYVALYNDASGLPDTTSPLMEDYNVAAVSAPGWAQFNYDSFEVTAARDFWVVLHWPPSSPNSPGVGADNFSPNLRSWWYNNTDGWNNWTMHNWMIRLMQTPGAGAIKSTPPSLPFCYKLYNTYPNPFNTNTLISFDIPEHKKVTLDIIDITGRKIRQLLSDKIKPGHHKLKWNGKNTTDKDVSTGIYFVRLKTGSFKSVRKILLIR